jgi:hypothetical protein
MPANRELPNKAAGTSGHAAWVCRVRAGVLGATVMAVLAGCGAQSRVVPLKPLTPSEALNLVKSIKPECHKPGHVLIHYASPVVHGKSSESWWCVEPAQSYRAVSRGLHCPIRTHLKIDFARHTAICKPSV